MTGMPAAATSPRDRVLEALSFRRPDRTPRDFAAVPEVWARLASHLGAADREGVLHRLGVDCRVVSYDAFCRPPRVEPDGSQRDIWGAHRRPVASPFGTLDQFASFPLASARDLGDLRRYPWPRPEWWDFRGLPAAIAALNGGERYHIRYRVGSVFENAWSLYGFERMLLDLAADPSLPVYVMERIAEVHLANLRAALAAAGDSIDLVYFYDDLASQEGLLMSPRLYERHIAPSHARIIELAREHGKPVMMHCCGAVRPLIPRLIDMGLAVLNPVQTSARGMDPQALAAEFGGRLAFHGGIDVQRFLPRATPEEVRGKVARTCEALGRSGGYILSGSHHFQADIPIENVLAMYGVDETDGSMTE